MITCKFGSVALLLAAFCASAQAQQDVCAKIIEHGLNNISLQTSVEAYADRLYWRFCDEKYESLSNSRKAEFAATVKAIPISLGGESASDQQKFSKFCGTYKTSTDRFSAQSVLTNKMHDKAIDAWGTCIEATRRQMFIEFSIPTSQQYADIVLRYTGSAGKTTFKGIETTEAKCTYKGDPVGAASAIEITPAETHFRCERSKVEQEIGGVRSRYYPEGGITVNTEAGSASVEFVAMTEGPAKSRMEVLDRNIQTVLHSLNALKAALKGGSDKAYMEQLGGGDSKGASMCPPGQYAVGLRAWGSPPSTKYCIGCVSGVQIVCQKLDVN